VGDWFATPALIGGVIVFLGLVAALYRRLTKRFAGGPAA
jgi:hypothetical protein